jgi:hypothetical protein
MPCAESWEIEERAGATRKHGDRRSFMTLPCGEGSSRQPPPVTCLVSRCDCWTQHMKALWRRDCTTPPTMVVVTCKAMEFSLFVDLDTH